MTASVDIRSGRSDVSDRPTLAAFTPARIVWGATAVAFLVLAVLTTSVYLRFGIQVFDMGIFDQGLWLLSRFETPFVTLRGLHLFADHSSYVMVLLAPLYWLWDDLRMLLLFNVAALVAGAPLVYAAARRSGAGGGLAATVGVAYLLHPAVAWNVWDAFHPEVVAVPVLILAFLLMTQERFGWAALAMAVVLLVKEDAALIVVPLAIYAAIRWKRPVWGAAMVGIGLGAFLLNFVVLLPHFSPFGELLYAGRYAQFGDSMWSALAGMITDPGEVVSTLATGSRAVYMATMILPLVLALAAPEVLLVAAPITAANLLSLHGYQHEIKYHYTAYFLATVAMAAAVGAGRLRRRLDQRQVPLAIGAVLFAALAGTIIAGPWGFGDRPHPWAGSTDRGAELSAALAVVPDDASVSADWFTATHLSHRTDIYMFPNPLIEWNWSMPGDDPPPADGAEWIVVQPHVPGSEGAPAEVLAELRADAAYELLRDDDLLVIFRRRPRLASP